jgi:SAM-dependent methyltransferase
MSNRSLRPLALLSATLRRIPGAPAAMGACDGHARSAAYCYSVWLRHLSLLHAHAGLARVPARVAELGPGPSLGTMLAAMFSGAEQGTALDITAHANSAQRNQKVLREIAALYQAHAPIPDDIASVGEIRPLPPNHEFPFAALEPTADAWKDPAREAMLRRMLESNDGALRYAAPWQDRDVMRPGSLDLIFSQAVMEHVDDLASTYGACREWLRPGGLMSHQIDFRCHGTARHWNGHYTLSDGVWNYMASARPYLLNREPPSVHRAMIKAAGFEIVHEQPAYAASALALPDLAPRFQGLEPGDLTTSGLYVVARRV